MLVAAKRLLIDVPRQMKWFNADVGSLHVSVSRLQKFSIVLMTP
jgi:hypothetical protein